MLYRTYGKTGEKVSSLGFGCMRFPTTPDGKIDESASFEMIDYAIEKGVNYFDTAYPYHGGESEVVVGKALKNHREKVFIATKLPSWLIKTREDMDRILNEQLEKLQTNYIDFYLVHALNKNSFYNLKDLGLFEFLNSIKEDGIVKHIGFSFHDELDVFKEIIDSYDWEFCQIQLNYLDVKYQAGLEGLKYAADKGIGVAIMEPLRGGRLATGIPKDIQDLWDTSEVKRTPVEWALKYLWSNDKVNVVLSGMSNFQQIVDNIRIAEKSPINELNEAELKLVSDVRERYESKIRVNCTKCRYCMPCPAGVDIPANFELLNNASFFDAVEEFRNHYNNLKSENKSSSCIKCGKCEKDCPQFIKIREKLEEVTATLK